MELLLTCRYCNHKWDKFIYYGFSMSDKNQFTCPSCRDSNVRVQEKDKSKKVDYYEIDPTQPIFYSGGD